MLSSVYILASWVTIVYKNILKFSVTKCEVSIQFFKDLVSSAFCTDRFVFILNSYMINFAL